MKNINETPNQKQKMPMMMEISETMKNSFSKK